MPCRACAAAPTSRPPACARSCGPSSWRPPTSSPWPTTPPCAPPARVRRMADMDAPRHAIQVSVATRYLDDQSVPEDDRYVFAYTIRIRNAGEVPARLLSRHWLITDANGHTQEVRGEVVVGEQPWLPA